MYAPFAPAASNLYDQLPVKITALGFVQSPYETRHILVRCSRRFFHKAKNQVDRGHGPLTPSVDVKHHQSALDGPLECRRLPCRAEETFELAI